MIAFYCFQKGLFRWTKACCMMILNEIVLPLVVVFLALPCALACAALMMLGMPVSLSMSMDSWEGSGP